MGAGPITLACLLLAAQTGDSDVNHVNYYQFNIPITVGPNKNADIRKIKLFHSLDEGRSWSLHSVAGPDQTQFAYLASENGKGKEGHYWFKVFVERTNDPDTPAPDLSKLPVSLKILVDLTAPEVRVDARGEGDLVNVHWEIKEDHPDVKTFKVEYRTADLPADKWKLVPEAIAGPKGDISFKPGSGSPVSVRVSVADKAGNVGSRTVDIPGSGVRPQVVAEQAPGMYAPNPVPLTPPPPPPAPGAYADHLPDTGPNYGQLPPIGSGTQPIPSQVPQTAQMPANALETTHPGAPTSGITQTADRQTVPLQGPGTGPAPIVPSGLPPVLYVNTPAVKIEFEVAKVGPSGLGGIDVYQTMDDGRSWEKCQPTDVVLPLLDDAHQDAAPRGSVKVQLLREEVIYGFSVVVKNGALNGKGPPQPGVDAPQWRVELDTRPPEAYLIKNRLPHPNRPDVIVLEWKATDRNLAEKPITLEWIKAPEDGSKPADVGWNFIGAPELPNIPSQIEWQVPAHMPPRVYLRLTVRDQAGNKEVQQTKEPQLIDLSVPEARILGISAVAPR